MAQITFVDGDVLTAANLNTYCAGEGGAWTSWTPAVTQSGSVTVTNTRSVYARYGRLIHVTFSVSVTGSGTAANNISITLPVTAAAADCGFGSGYLVDSSASLSYGFNVKLNTSSFNLATQVEAAGPTPFLGTNSFTAGLASGDTIRGGFTYEAAS